ncbi:MAG TPA: TetR/AcrR family transcriptional regulator [Actinocrinis sp.]|jgi:AcrR family transcriptional regulator
MTARADAAQETRRALLDAGLETAEHYGLSGMSVNRVVAAAGVAKGTFYVHFPDRAAFLSALHKRFRDKIGEAMQAAISDLPPGRAHLQRRMETYLDFCIRHQGVKALLHEARIATGVSMDVAARTAEFVALAEPDVRAMGWPDAPATARLVIAMASELALGEELSGGPDAAGRKALWRVLDRLDLSQGTPTDGPMI